ncbi:hypothetical protein AB0J72_08580 [Dactylosporangium sp. NPDC049742]|uniref:hypothetical protein n=1 Tax=Dactylosporangium sp. NPDC049742 TaxID=3154737 RepID=UPI00341E6B5C
MSRWAWVRCGVALAATIGIALPTAGMTILRGDAPWFFVGMVAVSAGPAWLYAWLVRTPVMSILVGVAYVLIDVLLPIPGYREAFVTGAGAGGWLFWYDGLLGVPLAWLSFLVGWGIDALIRYSTPPRPDVPRRG